MRKSLAVILSGAVAFPASKFDKFFRISASVILKKWKVVEQPAGVVGLVDAVDVAGGVLKCSMRLFATVGFLCWRCSNSGGHDTWCAPSQHSVLTRQALVDVSSLERC